MDERWCFQCGSAYVADVSECVECGVGLVDEPPASLEALSEAGVEQLAYELHEWAFESRRMVDQLLTSRAVVHAWQGASLLILERDEDAVDAIIEEVEQATLPTLDADLDHTVYEMAEWSADHQSRLIEALGLAGVPNQFDAQGDLVVHVEDEDEVDRLIDEVTAAIAAGEPEDAIELDGLGTNELLSRVFVSVDKLRRAPTEADSIIAFTDDAETLVRIKTPFGLDSRKWAEVVGLVNGLRLVYEQEIDDFDADHAAELAGAIRGELVQLI